MKKWLLSNIDTVLFPHAKGYWKNLVSEIPEFKEVHPYDKEGKENKFFNKALETYKKVATNDAIKNKTIPTIKRHVIAHVEANKEQGGNKSWRPGDPMTPLEKVRRRKREKARRKGRGEDSRSSEESLSWKEDEPDYYEKLSDIYAQNAPDLNSIIDNTSNKKLKASLEYITNLTLSERKYLRLLRKFKINENIK